MSFLKFVLQTTTPTNGLTSTPTTTPLEGSSILTPEMGGLLAFAALFVCIGCIYMVIRWGRTLEKQDFQRDSILDAIANQEAAGLIAQLDQKVYLEAIDPENHPFPDEAGTYTLYDFWLNYQTFLSYDPTTDIFYNDPKWAPEQKAQKQLEFNQDKRAKTALKIWGKEELKRYESEKKKIRDDARKKADKRLPSTMDRSLLGGGFSFILEFSTVIVIIFSVVILGVIGIVAGRDIVTILAAIAGYVLGKASASIQSQKTEQPKTEQPKTEDVTKKFAELEKNFEKLSKEFEEQSKKFGGSKKQDNTEEEEQGE
jgi:hypothetical protein